MKGTELIKLLKRDGWTTVRISGSHYIMVKDGFVDPLVVPVHGSKELKKGTLHAILRQAGLK